MPRNIPVGNGQMLVCFDDNYQIRDLYYPHVGQENHGGKGPCHFGIWAAIPQNEQTEHDRRKARLAWLGDGWERSLEYETNTLATNVTLNQPLMQVKLRCTDVVDFHRPLLVRRIEVSNLSDEAREIRLIHHQNFNLFGNSVGETAFYDDRLNGLVHYRNRRYLLATWHAEGEMAMSQYACGTAGFGGAEGTWRDAEDGMLSGSSIAQGAVDSTMLLSVPLEGMQTKVVYMIIAAGGSHDELTESSEFIQREGPQNVIDRTRAYWKLWLQATNDQFPTQDEGGPSDAAADLYRRSLLIVRTQIDNSGAIIAANDSDIMQFGADTYSYLWPRDGALVAAAMDSAGFPNVGRSFYTLCSKLITDEGYFLHKYNPDGSPASSWHPWVSQGNPQLPIQEDETALVTWALWRHYERYKDIEFVRPLWNNLIVNSADFMVRFRDPVTKLPLPSYDLWEERYGVHAFTVATVYGGLHAASQFASCFGDTKRAQVYAKAAEEVREAFCKYFWSEKLDRFLRRIMPTDIERNARLMREVMDGRKPKAKTEMTGDLMMDPAPVEYELDEILDSSTYAIFLTGMLDPNDERVVKTMRAIEHRLWIKTPVGGIARYENDYYHSVTDDIESVPGNPWFICTLWLAQWHIAKAQTLEELQDALPIFEWVASHALPSGVLAEQVHPLSNDPLSVSPLTWSHATVVASMVEYREKYAKLCRNQMELDKINAMIDHSARPKSQAVSSGVVMPTPS